MSNLKLEIIDTHWRFLPADSLLNVIKFHQIKKVCLYVTLFFILLTLKTSKSLVIIKISLKVKETLNYTNKENVRLKSRCSFME